MRIEEVRKIMDEKKCGWRIAYITKDDLAIGSILKAKPHVTPEHCEPPLDTFDEADNICQAMLSSSAFLPYGIVKAWVQEV